MEAQDIMARHPACCTPDTRLTEVSQLMVQYDCGAIPVVESLYTLKVVGIVTDRDIIARVCADGTNPHDKQVRDCMSRPVTTVSPSTPLAECCRLMARHRVRRLPVVDEHGVLCGLLSQTDIAAVGECEEAAEVLRQVSHPKAARSLQPVG